MDETKPIYNGARAKEVLDNEVFQWALGKIKDEVTEAWKNSPARDQEGREKLWMMLSLANKLEAVLLETLTTGKMREKALEAERTWLERVKSGMF